MDYLQPLWNVLEETDEINLYEAIKKAELHETESIEEIKKILRDFTKKWEWVDLKTFTKKGMEKKIRELAFSELFGFVMLLHKCRNTPPKNPSNGGGLPVFFEKLEQIHMLKPNHPNYKYLVDVRYGRIP